MPVREMLARMGSDEFSEWLAFYQLEPFGDLRGDYRSGVVAATLANVHRTKESRAFRPEDFMPFLEQPESEGGQDGAGGRAPMFYAPGAPPTAAIPARPHPTRLARLVAQQSVEKLSRRGCDPLLRKQRTDALLGIS